MDNDMGKKKDERVKIEEERRAAIAFVRRYQSMGLHLARCPFCYRPPEIEYQVGAFVRIYCPNGCGIVTHDNAAKASTGKLSDTVLVRTTVNRWNGCDYDE